MNHGRYDQPRRGLTLLELMFAVTITAIVGAALTATIGAITIGVDTQRDTRSHIVRAHAAQSRLGAYVAPSRAILMAENSKVVLWFNDSRESETIHGSEIRWLIFDPAAGSIKVHFLRLPSNWTPMQRLLADREHRKDSDWLAVFEWYESRGLVDSVALVDGLADVEAGTEETNPQEARHLLLSMTFEGAGGEVTTLLGGTLMRHRPPKW